MIIDFNKPDDPDGNVGGGNNSEESSDSNLGTLILESTGSVMIACQGSLRYNMAGRNTRYVQNHNRSKEKNH